MINIEDFKQYAEENFLIRAKNGEMVPFRLFDCQEIILRRLLEAQTSQKKGILLGFNRQVGASSLISMLSLYLVMTEAGVNIVTGFSNECHMRISRELLNATVENIDPAKAGHIWLSDDGIVVMHGSATSSIRMTCRVNRKGRKNPGVKYLFLDSVCSLRRVTSFLRTYKHAMTVIKLLPKNRMGIWESFGPQWDRLFIPWFMEKARAVTPPEGWTPQKQEVAAARKIKRLYGVELTNDQMCWREKLRLNCADAMDREIFHEKMAIRFKA